MSVRIQRGAEPQQYFITFTCCDWIPLFEITKSYDAIYKWFDWMHNHLVAVNAYCIMPNHVHLLLTTFNEQQSINKIIGNGKRFLAYEIVRRLKANHPQMLQKLADARSATEIKSRKLHKVFESSFDCKAITTRKFEEQKMNYIHMNPLRRNPPLAMLPEDYPYSSAAFYITGDVSNFHGIVSMEDWMIKQQSK